MKNAPEEITTEIPQKLIDNLIQYIADSNNHLMNLSVSGDNILRSADIIREARKLINLLKELKSKGIGKDKE